MKAKKLPHNMNSSGQESKFSGHSQLLSVTPNSDSTYAKLGQVELVDFISFAYQIAAGMVRNKSTNHVKLSTVVQEDASLGGGGAPIL